MENGGAVWEQELQQNFSSLNLSSTQEVLKDQQENLQKNLRDKGLQKDRGLQIQKDLSDEVLQKDRGLLDLSDEVLQKDRGLLDLSDEVLQKDLSDEVLQKDRGLLDLSDEVLQKDLSDEVLQKDRGLLDLSDEVLLLIMTRLDPTALLRLGSTCRTMFRVCSCNSLWTKHFQASFVVSFPAHSCRVSAKVAFRWLFMWKTLFRNLHCNRTLQERLFSEVPLLPQRYWTQWLVLEETVPLPRVRMSAPEVQTLWGVSEKTLQDQAQGTGTDDSEVWVLVWKDLYALAVKQHGNASTFFQYVLNQQENNDHSELEVMYFQYTQCRYQWFFSYWLFSQAPPFNRQLRGIFLQWRKHNSWRVANWGGTLCDVRYLASLHPITADYWRGKLALGDEAVGIQVVENYFSMCKSLMAWILGRDWGRLKRRKVYLDTLDGVYLVLRQELQDGLVEHYRFWQVAKLQMSRVCALEDLAQNYVNWRLIDTLPYYKLYLLSGNPVYLLHLQNFLLRKRQLHNWINMEVNSWARSLLQDDLYTHLEYDAKISQESLHGQSVGAQLNRLIWLYLNSGQQLYLEAVKGFVLLCAKDRLSAYRIANHLPVFAVCAPKAALQGS